MIRFSVFFGIMLFIPYELPAHGMSEADQQRMLEAGYGGYLWLGAKHMLTGYDHLLFLFGVIFFLVNMADVLKFITVFTIGHCITLLYATFFEIRANVYLVDAVIALTVIYKGFDNLDGFRRYLDVKSPNLLVMVFVFGLIHGFGLSTRLQQLPLGEDFSGLALRILSFNAGVEIGQVTALAVMILLLSGWRLTESFKKFGQVANVGLMVAGFLLFLMQLHGYQHRVYPETFPLNVHEHQHQHETMKSEP
ncbi:MAG: HupE/UreJ family protein [Verrucomicrobiota bacterium]